MPGRLLRNLREYGRVMGAIDAATHARMRQLYARVVHGPLSEVSLLEAEVVKTFENTYRDVEIALANEFARYCDALGVDALAVRREVNKVVDRNLHVPGVGVGGHCIPKDTLLLAHGSRGRFTPELMLLARRLNDGMPAYTARRAVAVLQGAGVAPGSARVAILGYSYLGESDDVRNTPVLPLRAELQGLVGEVVVHDPFVPDGPGQPIVADLEAALRGADLAIVATAHRAYRDASFAAWRSWMRTPLLLDGRACLDLAAARVQGFATAGIGVPATRATTAAPPPPARPPPA